MARLLFCHEQELLRRFSEASVEGPISWDECVIMDDFWGETELGLKDPRFNVNFRSMLIDGELPPDFFAMCAPIHPAWLGPALCTAVDRSTGKVILLELLNGEWIKRRAFRKSLSLIEQCVAQVDLLSFRQLRWWRVFAMFDRLPFLVVTSDHRAACVAERRRLELPAGLSGECFVLYDGEQPIGLDGWLEHPTGFGADADV